MPKIELISCDYVPKELLKFVKENGDAEFNVSIPETLHHLFPEGLVYSYASAVALNVKNVVPHTDDPVGEIDTNYSLFGVLSDPGYHAYLHVGNSYVQLVKGSWYKFSDRVLHSVQAEKKFSCVAIQCE
jgi:hypothetical protein